MTSQLQLVYQFIGLFKHSMKFFLLCCHFDNNSNSSNNSDSNNYVDLFLQSNYPVVHHQGNVILSKIKLQKLNRIILKSSKKRLISIQAAVLFFTLFISDNLPYFWTFLICEFEICQPGFGFGYLSLTYRVLNGFGQAKFAAGGSILGSSQLSLLSELPLKMALDLKVVKIESKIIISLV